LDICAVYPAISVNIIAASFLSIGMEKFITLFQNGSQAFSMDAYTIESLD